MASTQNQLGEIAKNLTSMAAQISDLARKMSALEPLVPLAAKLDALPDQVTQVQASAFEYSEQVRALNLAVQHRVPLALRLASRATTSHSMTPTRDANATATTWRSTTTSCLAPSSSFPRTMARAICYHG
jgi:ABC-type transporter Mla subunit MlaD